MDINWTNMPELILATAALLIAIAALIGLLGTRRRLAQLQQQLDEYEQQIHFIQQSLSGLTAGAVGMDRRMVRLEAGERRLSERQETFENQQASERPYSHAIRLVRQGAGTARLVEELGLSESEADLIVRLHGGTSGEQGPQGRPG